MIVGKQVGKRFGSLVALDALDLRVEAGEVCALVGPNGAGKSTTLALLAGALRATSGTAAIESARVGWLPQEPAFDSALPLSRTLRRHARLLGLSRRDAEPEVAAALRRFDILDLAHRRPRTLSAGQRRRAALALAWIGSPDVLLLDEPTATLDPVQTQRVLEEIGAAAAGGAAVLLGSNRLEELPGLATGIVVLDAGRSVFSGTPSELTSDGTGLRAAVLGLLASAAQGAADAA